jgi:curved DNA-binding protein CbpA
MGNQQGKPNVYQQYYDALQNRQSTSSIPSMSSSLPAIGDMNVDNVNPYDVLGVSKQFTWEDLKNSYHRLARLVHPDKGGSEKLFNLVTDCFRKLANEYKLRQDSKPHHELKKESQRYHENHSFEREQPSMFEQQMPPPPINTSLPDTNNFNERFNRLFDEFKIEDEEQRGYGHIMTASSKNRDDIHIEQKMKKFTNESFNEEFNRIPIRQQVVKYKEPEALVLTKNIAFTEIGQQSSDFTYNDPSAKSGLFYTDYMQAFDEGNQRLIDPNSVKRKEFKNVDQYDAYRAQKTGRKLTTKELQMMAKQKQMEEEREKERMERVRRQDEIYSLQHEKVKQKMLQR